MSVPDAPTCVPSVPRHPSFTGRRGKKRFFSLLGSIIQDHLSLFPINSLVFRKILTYIYTPVQIFQ
jgi:hypothetical protein